MTYKAFENAMVTVMATGGSTNAVLHYIAMARAAGVPLSIDDFQRISDKVCVWGECGPPVGVRLYMRSTEVNASGVLSSCSDRDNCCLVWHKLWQSCVIPMACWLLLPHTLSPRSLCSTTHPQHTCYCC